MKNQTLLTFDLPIMAASAIIPWLLMFLLCSCASAPTSPSTPIAPAGPLASSGAADRLAICVGLTAVDPAAYDNWAGECPGADIDARGVYQLCVAQGFTAQLLLNSSATWAAVRSTVLSSASALKPGSLLVIMLSGHGGQIADANGDEADGLDETICLWDGAVRDDLVLTLLRELPAGIRVVLINDQCHSEGSFRGVPRKARALVRVKTPWAGQLIQFAGCREASYSYGSDTGGTWTQALLASFAAGQTWQAWFSAAALRMPDNQVPVWVEYGTVTDSFRLQEALR